VTPGQPAGPWHLGWQEAVPLERREVTIGPHLLRRRRHDGAITEPQHGAICPDVVAQREAFYSHMVWLFDAIEPAARRRLTTIVYPGQQQRCKLFEWKHARKSAGVCGRPHVRSASLGPGGG
jgi:hypothetical protein